MPRRLKHWGWGYEDEQPGADELRAQAALLSEHFGFGRAEPEPAVPLDDVVLPAPVLQAPGPLAGICSTDRYERALHAYGRSYRDVVRAFRGALITRPMSWPARVTSTSSSRCSTGRWEPGRRSSRSGAGRASSVASSPRSIASALPGW